jgi:hypothetical protein
MQPPHALALKEVGRAEVWRRTWRQQRLRCVRICERGACAVQNRARRRFESCAQSCRAVRGSGRESRESIITACKSGRFALFAEQDECKCANTANRLVYVHRDSPQVVCAVPERAHHCPGIEICFADAVTIRLFNVEHADSTDFIAHCKRVNLQSAAPHVLLFDRN